MKVTGKFYWIGSVAGILAAASLCGLLLRRTGEPEPVVQHPVIPETATPDCAVKMEAVRSVQPAAPLLKDPERKLVTVVLPERTQPLSAPVELVLASHCFDEQTCSAVRDLPETLPQDDYVALAECLLTPQPGRDADYRQHEYALRNEMMLALIRDPTRLSDTMDILTAVFDDQRQGDVMRGYALQHLAGICTSGLVHPDPSGMDQVVQTLFAAIGERSKGTVTSTGLIALQEISFAHSSVVSSGTVRREALDLLNDSDAGYTSAISALQICTELGESDAVPFARQAAFDPTANWGLRVSSVYVLGELDDAQGLEPLLTDTDKYVRRAAHAALEKKGRL